MKKFAGLTLAAIMAISLGAPVMAAENNVQGVKSYDISVVDNLKVPYSGSTDTYFKGGMVTGFGSGVTFKGFNEEGEMQFYAVTDRGPNADAAQYEQDGTIFSSKVFPVPEFTPSIGLLTIKKDGSAVVESSIEIKDSSGQKITGLPLEQGQVGATGEVALTEDYQQLNFDNEGLDTEGIAIDKDGNMWLCDEYGPFLVKVDPEGNILEKYAPGDGLPEILSQRIPNRGFEGLTITPSGKIIVAVQSVLDVDGETSKTATFTRIVEFDPETKQTRTFAYPVELSQYKSAKDCKIGDIYAIDDNHLLVIEQGKTKNKGMSNLVYRVDLTEATDISDITYQGKAPEYAPAQDDLEGVVYAEKSLLIDLVAHGWTAEKAEGICLLPDNKTVAVINDNDFGLVTKTTDAENKEADITDYVYHTETGTYTLDGNEASPVTVLGENTEPAQIWMFTMSEPLNVFDSMTLDVNVSRFTSGGKTFVKLRDLAEQLKDTNHKFSIEVADRQINITTGASYQSLGSEFKSTDTNGDKKVSNWTLIVDGKVVEGLQGYNVNGNNYYELEGLKEALGI